MRPVEDYYSVDLVKILANNTKNESKYEQKMERET